jgi:hypothetical protein
MLSPLQDLANQNDVVTSKLSFSLPDLLPMAPAQDPRPDLTAPHRTIGWGGRSAVEREEHRYSLDLATTCRIDATGEGRPHRKPPRSRPSPPKGAARPGRRSPLAKGSHLPRLPPAAIEGPAPLGRSPHNGEGKEGEEHQAGRIGERKEVERRR